MKTLLTSVAVIVTATSAFAADTYSRDFIKNNSNITEICSRADVARSHYRAGKNNGVPAWSPHIHRMEFTADEWKKAVTQECGSRANLVIGGVDDVRAPVVEATDNSTESALIREVRESIEDRELVIFENRRGSQRAIVNMNDGNVQVHKYDSNTGLIGHRIRWNGETLHTVEFAVNELDSRKYERIQ